MIQTEATIARIHAIVKISRVRPEKRVLNGFLIRLALTSQSEKRARVWEQSLS
jgi:hypothetical protein